MIHAGIYVYHAYKHEDEFVLGVNPHRQPKLVLALESHCLAQHMVYTVCVKREKFPLTLYLVTFRMYNSLITD